MRPLGLVIWRLRHSRLRRAFHAAVAVEIARSNPQGWLPDVGSGPGLLAQRLMEDRAGLRVVCVDVEPGMLRAAGSAGCRYLVRASADHLPIRTAACGTVVSTATLKDWADRAGGLSEISRVLRSGGTGFVYDFLTVGPGSNPPGFVRRFGILAELLRRRMGRMIPFSLDDLAALAEGVESDVVKARVEEFPEFGAARLLLSKAPNA